MNCEPNHVNRFLALISGILLACVIPAAAQLPAQPTPTDSSEAVSQKISETTSKETPAVVSDKKADELLAEGLEPLKIVDVQSIFASASGGSDREMLLNIGDLVRMTLANNPNIKIMRLEPDVVKADILRAWSVFDPSLSLQTQYSTSDTPQNAQQYIEKGGQNTQSQALLTNSYNTFQYNVSQEIDRYTLISKQLGTWAGDVAAWADKVRQSGTGAAGEFPTYPTPPAAVTPVTPPVPSGYTLLEPTIYNSEDYIMQLGLGGRLPLGTRYSLSLNQLRSANDLNRRIPPALWTPEYTTLAGITLAQPLLKNFGTDVNLAGVRIARLQKRISWYEWQQQIIYSLGDALSRFYNLAFAVDNMQVHMQAIEVARALERQNLQKVAQGRSRASEVWEAQTSVSHNVDATLHAINDFAEAQAALKSTIFSSQMALSGTCGRLIPATKLDIPTIKIDRAKFISDALAKRPEYLQLLSKAEQEGIRVSYARNQTYPTVELQGTYGLTGLEGSYGDSFNKAVDGQGTSYSVGIGVSIPLGNMEARANLEAAKLRQKQAKLAVEKSLTTIATEVDLAISSVETALKQVAVAHDTSEASMKSSAAQEKLLDEGKTTTFEVVRIQNGAAADKSRELYSIAEYRKSLVRLSMVRGTLLEELGLSLEKEAAVAVPEKKKKDLDLPKELKGSR